MSGTPTTTEATVAEAVTSAAGPTTSYLGLLRDPKVGRLLTSSLLAEVTNQMQVVVLVLLALERYGSARLAGLVVFASIFPGLLVSPLAGALLDRYGRLTLISLDYWVAAVALLAVGLLDVGRHLPAPALVGIVAFSSLTTPLRAAGIRALLPQIVPRRAWDRVNALDSARYVVAAVVGPPVAGSVVALHGPDAGLLTTAAVVALGAVLLVGLHLPAGPAAPRGRLLGDARASLGYVVRHRVLRWLAISVGIFNLGGGLLLVALPVVVLHRLGGGPQVVGISWTVYGLGGLIGGLAAGRCNTEGREWAFLALGGALATVGLGALAVAAAPPTVFAAVALVGVANGPLDVALFSLRQRATDPRWYGRAFAVSMSLNYLGVPIGSAIAGPLAGHDVAAALLAAAAVTAVSGVIPVVWLRGWERGRGIAEPRLQTAAGSRTGGRE